MSVGIVERVRVRVKGEWGVGMEWRIGAGRGEDGERSGVIGRSRQAWLL